MMSAGLIRRASLVAAFALAACGDPVTEIVVVSDTTLAVPAGVDAVRFTVDATEIGGGRSSSTVDLTSARPATVGVVHRAGPLGPILIEAEGLSGTTTVLSRRARVTFVEGRVMMLRLDLDARCVGRDCGADGTCGLGGTCGPYDRALEPWPGQAAGLDGGQAPADDGGGMDGGSDGGPGDAGPGDAGPCTPSTEVCNGVDDDCDGDIDDGFDLRSSPENCGACGVVCSGACVDRACVGARLSVAAGGSHSCALDAAGGVLCWGQNDAGQLGTGDTTASPIPVAVTGLPASPATALAAGDDHTCALLEDRNVWCWGANAAGQVDGVASADVTTPVMILDGASAVSAGGRHSCAIRSSAVFCWGANDEGQLGVTTGGPAPVEVPGLPSNAVDVAAGAAHSCAALEDGSVWCWGRGDDRQIDGNLISGAVLPAPALVAGMGAVQVAAGQFHSCARSDDGSVRCWGTNSRGQLGRPLGGVTTPQAVVEASDAIWLTAGALHTCAVTGDGRGLCWGDNAARQLGAGSTLERSATPLEVTGERLLNRISAGETHTCARRGDGAVVCWGTGDLGDGGGDSPTPVVVPLP